MGAQSRAERVAYNESVFRDANERLVDVFRREADGEVRLPFLCECADTACTEIVMLAFEEYVEVREHPAHFVTLPGHEEPDTEIVVDSEGRYQVVEKSGEAASVAVRLSRDGRAG